jgi:hypothetical protein
VWRDPSVCAGHVSPRGAEKSALHAAAAKRHTGAINASTILFVASHELVEPTSALELERYRITSDARICLAARDGAERESTTAASRGPGVMQSR